MKGCCDMARGCCDTARDVRDTKSKRPHTSKEINLNIYTKRTYITLPKHLTKSPNNNDHKIYYQ